ncbi:hypothetical protein JZ751_019949 [Albula glossodonta]|uniref:Uncharacterized protein n=1 Tax=Albula glossodonta TaxID=121402 RepID=A0A8T2N3P3_9TELE|nr:hypothetical protein JZ751_019949 [Albula glossodonta]
MSQAQRLLLLTAQESKAAGAQHGRATEPNHSPRCHGNSAGARCSPRLDSVMVEFEALGVVVLQVEFEALGVVVLQVEFEALGVVVLQVEFEALGVVVLQVEFEALGVVVLQVEFEALGVVVLQVEFEAVKLELTHKEEEQELLRAQLEEAGRLREITGRQLEEALEALKEEREQKNSLRRELSSLAANPFGSAAHLELHLEQLEESQDEARPEDQDSGYNPGRPNGHLRSSTPRSSDAFLRPPAPGLVADLLSELHLSDSQKLQQQLLQVCYPHPLTPTPLTYTHCTLHP